VPYVVAEGIEALGTIYVHVRTTPLAPKVLASFAALVAGGIKRAASQIHLFCTAVGSERREAHATCVVTATTPLLPGTGEDLRFIHLDPANVDQSR
jgi:hypothetical protein